MKSTLQLQIVTGLVCALSLMACQSPVQEAQIEQTISAAIDAPSPQYLYTFGTPAELVNVMEWGRIPEGQARERAKEESSRIALPGMQRGTNLFGRFEKDYSVSVGQALRNAIIGLSRDKDDESQFMAEQTLGVLLLDKFLARGELTTVPPSVLAQRELTRDEQAVVGFATKLLTSNAYPNADLLAASIQTVAEYWPDSEIRTQAKLAIKGANTFLSRSECETCAAKGAPAGKNARRDQIQEGIILLRRIAGE